jgi:hypothetical protein
VAAQVEPDVTVVQPVSTIWVALPTLTLKTSVFEVRLSPVARKLPEPATAPVKVTCATPFVKMAVPE